MEAVWIGLAFVGGGVTMLAMEVAITCRKVFSHRRVSRYMTDDGTTFMYEVGPPSDYHT